MTGRTHLLELSRHSLLTASLLSQSTELTSLKLRVLVSQTLLFRKVHLVYCQKIKITISFTRESRRDHDLLRFTRCGLVLFCRRS